MIEGGGPRRNAGYTGAQKHVYTTKPETIDDMTTTIRAREEPSTG
jgi:hypothetical protein